MKFDMGSSTIATLTQETDGSAGELTALIQMLIAAAEPLEGKFNGEGKVAFDQFKLNSDDVSHALNSALNAILGGQSGMDQSFGEGDQEHGDNSRQAMGAANFDAARFSGR